MPKAKVSGAGTQNPKPSLFIGSSTESLAVANILQQQLQHDANINVWNQGLFGISSYTLDELLKATKKFDFAAFVFGADDTLKSRKKRYLVARDNVALEFGIFVGALGRTRTFMVVQRTKEQLHLPSDLQGISPAMFDWQEGKRYDDDFAQLHAALGSSAQSLRAAIKAGGANGSDDTRLKPLSGGMIFLALLLRGRGHSLQELATPFQDFQNESNRITPGSSAYAAKAAKYACQCLEAVGMATNFGGDEYALTPLGEDLIDSEKLRKRFASSYSLFERLKKKPPSTAPKNSKPTS